MTKKSLAFLWFLQSRVYKIHEKRKGQCQEKADERNLVDEPGIPGQSGEPVGQVFNIGIGKVCFTQGIKNVEMPVCQRAVSKAIKYAKDRP